MRKVALFLEVIITGHRAEYLFPAGTFEDVSRDANVKMQSRYTAGNGTSCTYRDI